MTLPLPHKNFRMIDDPEELRRLEENIMNLSFDDPIGYLVECSIYMPVEAMEENAEFPPAGLIDYRNWYVYSYNILVFYSQLITRKLHMNDFAKRTKCYMRNVWVLVILFTGQKSLSPHLFPGIDNSNDVSLFHFLFNVNFFQIPGKITCVTGCY